MDLAQRYRPRRFADVIGQDVTWFTRQVTSGAAKSVILAGPPGVGKTSLGRLYGQALQCERCAEDGSPCDTCEQCEFYKNSDHHPESVELDCTRFGRFDDIEEQLLALEHQPLFGRRRVLFADEAHKATTKSLEAMLKPLERSQGWVTFVFATTEPGRLPAAIRSRCAQHDLKPVGFEIAIRHLQMVSEAEGYAYDADGLALIAETSHGQVRDMLVRLEKVAEAGAVTPSNVRRLLGLDHVDRVAGYLGAALDGDLQAQLDGLENWNEEASNKAAAVEGLLAFLFVTEVLRLYRRSRVFDGLAAADRSRIVAAMRHKSQEFGIPEQEFWQETVDLWRPLAGGMTEATLLAQIVRFNSFLNGVRVSG
jgi:DNA polymerase-3 subunit gamma/tau